MTAPLQFAAAKINTDTAGSTGGTEAQPMPALTPVSFEGAVMNGLFAGGAHPESSLFDVVDHSLERATNSVRGPMGGLRPLANGTQAPGPAGGSAVAAEVNRVTTMVASSSAWGRVRKLFGVQ